MSDNLALQHSDVKFVRPCNLCPHMKCLHLFPEPVIVLAKSPRPQSDGLQQGLTRQRESVDIGPHQSSPQRRFEVDCRTALWVRPPFGVSILMLVEKGI
jgi:hypothetical protein